MSGCASVGRQPSMRSSFDAFSIRFSMSRIDSRYSPSFRLSSLLMKQHQEVALRLAMLRIDHQDFAQGSLRGCPVTALLQENVAEDDPWP